jgi:hypothetical protein
MRRRRPLEAGGGGRGHRRHKAADLDIVAEKVFLEYTSGEDCGSDSRRIHRNSGSPLLALRVKKAPYDPSAIIFRAEQASCCRRKLAWVRGKSIDRSA